MPYPIHQILKQFWGFDQFRPLQEDIVTSILDGKDTLALLPTGGGKSVCFQVPALAMPGITLVISPLIALMKDQVENLKSRGIQAVALTSELNFREIDIALDNCIYGKNEDGSNKIKLLYMSPERLGSELVQRRLHKMNISFIAVDEAHCISQWGYDFRPSYLKIAETRDFFPEVPILALTATATPDVVVDIQEKLLFKKKNVLSKSFNRSNLAYIVLEEENKPERILKIINNVQGSGLIYVRNRRATKEIATWLNHHRIPAMYYHAGLDIDARTKIQEDWKQNRTRIIVCTNAFGMGIDKPDVRFVIHHDPPDSLEAYFQEAGRAGRDEKKAYAIMLYNPNDQVQLEENYRLSFPDKTEIKRAYQAICNYFQVAIGAGENQVYDFDIASICSAYNLNSLTFFNSLKFLERDGFITITDALFQTARLHINCNKNALYDFQLRNMEYDSFIKLLLRSYSGLFDDYVKINEFEIARRFNTTKERVIKMLDFLNEYEIASYIPQKNLPQLLFNHERQDSSHLLISKENYDDRKLVSKKKIEAVISYATGKDTCRNTVLLNYLGEIAEKDCGQCDVCIEKKKKEQKQENDSKIKDKISDILKSESITINQLLAKFSSSDENRVIECIRWMIDEGEITKQNDVLIAQTK